METMYRTAAEPWELRGDVGNHRVVVKVTTPGEYVRIGVDWRRRDLHPERCGVLAHRMEDNSAVNVKAVSVTRRRGEFVLEAPEPGEYALYYMPCRLVGDSWWNPVIEYAGEAFQSYSPEWERGIPADMPQGEVIAIESRTEFDSFYPMELPAWPEEAEALLKPSGNAPFLVFPEERKYPVRMLYELPYRWVQRGLQNEFIGRARPDEYYVFQLAVLAREELEEISLEYRGFSGDIPVKAEDITCYNREGVDWLGRPFTKKLSCPKGQIQPLWFGLMLPADRTGELSFEIVLSASGHSETVSIRIRSEGEPIASHGDGELWRLSRLRWLNSAVGMDDEAAKPYSPVRREGDTLFCLGRSVTLAENGLPAEIVSYFDQSIRVWDKALPILREPVMLEVRTPQGKVDFSGFQGGAVCEEEGVYGLETVGSGEGLSLKVRNSLEYDGHMETFLTLTAQRETEISDIALHVAMTPECSRYMMGMGRAGGVSPASWEYRWDERYANNYVWIGGVNGGCI